MANDRRHFSVKSAPPRLYRVTFGLDVSKFTPWRYQRGFGRWDDERIARMREIVSHAFEHHGLPEDEFFAALMHRKSGGPFEHRLHRVLSTASTEEGALIEVLQDFRRSHTAKSQSMHERLAAVVQDDPDFVQEPLDRGGGVVPSSLLSQLCVGTIQVEDAQAAVDVEGFETIHALRAVLLEEAQRRGLVDFDRGAVLSKHRELTQRIAKAIYEDPQRFAGITHGSVLGLPYQNWALFETVDGGEMRSILRGIEGRRVRLDDPALQQAVERLDLQLEGVRGLQQIVDRERKREEDLELGDEMER